MINDIALEDKAIAVWDVEDKKISMIFLSAKALMQVLFQLQPNQLNYWIDNKKTKIHSNRTICFRYAKLAIIEKLPALENGQKGYQCDQRFSLSARMLKLSENFFQMSSFEKIQQKIKSFFNSKQKKVTTMTPYFKNMLVVESTDFNSISADFTKLIMQEFRRVWEGLQKKKDEIDNEIDELTDNPRYYNENMSQKEANEVREYVTKISKLYGQRELITTLISELKEKY